MEIIERLLAEMVAGDQHLAGLRVDQHKGEHAAQEPASGVPAVARQQLDQHFGIGGGAQINAARHKLAAQFGVVVDLAVIGQQIAAAGVAERLVGRRRGVDDRQPRVAQRVALAPGHILAVGTAHGDMGHGAGHPRIVTAQIGGAKIEQPAHGVQ